MSKTLNLGLGMGLPQAAGSGKPNPGAGFALIRTVPGTMMRNPPNIIVIAPALAGQGVSP